jgi:hypothetical protein
MAYMDWFAGFVSWARLGWPKHMERGRPRLASLGWPFHFFLFIPSSISSLLFDLQISN